MPKLPSKTSQSRMNRVVNELGDIRQEIERLEAREKVLKAKLVSARFLKVTTDKFEMDMRRYERAQVDYESLVGYLKVSDMLIKRYTKLQKVTQVRIKRR